MKWPSSALIVVAHPDDEVLGCGGLIGRLAGEGVTVNILIMSEGVTSRDADQDTDGRAADVSALRQAAKQAAKTLGAAPPRFLGLSDNRMDGLELLDVIKRVETVIDEVRPDTVFTHHGGDLNVDHQITNKAVLTACRPLPEASVVAIYTFETLSSTEWSPSGPMAGFVPTLFVDITNHIKTKIRALDCYRTEMRTFPHPRSVEAIQAMSTLRGAHVGRPAVEAFEVIREIV